MLALEDVAVYTQPVFEDPSNVTAIAGNNAKLQCKVHHLENYTVRLCVNQCVRMWSPIAVISTIEHL